MQSEQVSVEYAREVGKSVTRLDARQKVSGVAKYVNDIKLPNMLYAKVKRSTEPHAIIRSVDVSRAANISGVVAIITGNELISEDTPGHPPALAAQRVRFVGEGVAAVAAEDMESAERAVEEIDVDLERLPFAINPETAMSESSGVMIHKTELGKNVAAHVKVRIGDVEKGFEESDLVVENTYTTQVVQHLPVGPLTAVGEYRHDGGLTIFIGSQNANDVQDGVCSALGLESSQVRVVEVPFIGGWFGMNGDVEVAVICGALTMKARRPVKLQLTREEVFTTLAVRHPAKITVKDGVSKDGMLLARKVTATFAGGAYARRANSILRNVVFASATLYRVKHFHLDAYRVYTNHLPSQQMRAPYGPQTVFAIESQMDEIAGKLHIDPVEFRLANLNHEGDRTAIGEKLESLGIEDCIEEVNAGPKRRGGEGIWKRGWGMAIGVKWSSGNLPFGALARLKSDGRVEIWTNVVDLGQGIFTGIAQIAAEELRMNLERIVIAPFIYGTDSTIEMPGSGPSGSRQLYNNGNAVILACRDLKSNIFKAAAELTKRKESDLDFEDGYVIARNTKERIIRATELFQKADHAGSFEGKNLILMGKGLWQETIPKLRDEDGRAMGDRAVTFYTPAVTSAQLSVNTKTGQVVLEKLVAAIDAGRAINPSLVEGQVVGATIMGVGYAMLEELVIGDDGWVVNGNLSDYKPPYAADVPEIEPRVLEGGHPHGPFGAKGVGEAPIMTVAPAIANAIFDAVGVRVRDLPLTRDKILLALRGRTQNQ